MEMGSYYRTIPISPSILIYSLFYNTILNEMIEWDDLTNPLTFDGIECKRKYR